MKQIAIPICFLLILQLIVLATSERSGILDGSPLFPGAFAQESQNVNPKYDNLTAPYENTDFGFKINYPATWIVNEKNLEFNTLVSFSLIQTNIYDFTNTTLAEVDVRVFSYPDKKTAADLSLSDINTKKHIMVLNVSEGTLGGQRSLDIVGYTFDQYTTKHLRVVTITPKKENVKLEILYVAQAPEFATYLNVVEKMLKSFQFTN